MATNIRVATLAVVTCCIVATTHAATTWYVKPGGDDDAGGDSWSSAFKTLTAAIEAAGAGDEIWVTAGVYKPTDDDDRAKSFLLPQGVALYGGFAGSETSREQRDWQEHPTILSGDIGVEGELEDNSYHVVVVGGEGARLDGFVICDGYANGSGAETVANRINGYGAGLYSYGVSLTLVNCTFTNNHAISTGIACGGGAYWGQGKRPESRFECRDNTFVGNSVSVNAVHHPGGGGLALRFHDTLATQVLISNCLFHANVAQGGTAFAAALGLQDDARIPWVAEGRLDVIDCHFKANSNMTSKGAMMVKNFIAPVHLTHCIFEENYAYSSDGGALFVNLPMIGAGLQVESCSFSGNYGSNGGAVLFETGGGTNSCWRNCDFFSNRANGYGGALYGPLDGTFDSCRFTNNAALKYGGGAMRVTGTGAVSGDLFTNCLFFANSNESYGGGAIRAEAPLRVSDCHFEANRSNLGGAIWIKLADTSQGMLVDNCHFSNNNSSSHGGAVYFEEGGGTNSTWRNTIFVNNSATPKGYGGAVAGAIDGTFDPKNISCRL